MQVRRFPLIVSVIIAVFIVVSSVTLTDSQERRPPGIADADFSTLIEGQGLKYSPALPRSELGPNDRFQLGTSSIGIQTEKSVRILQPLRPSDCESDDECADYSGLPKTEPRKKTLKNLRKPFIGFSVTTPLQ